MTDDQTKADAELLAAHGSSFGSQAAQYAEYRPGYPVDAIDWLLPAGAVDVLDLAAGTGKLTEGLLGRDLKLTAVEPSEPMLDQLRKRFPSVTALVGTAERIPLADSSVDAVLVGQAFHWFDPLVALNEIGRVLRPGGRLGALWNRENDRVDWVSGFEAITKSPVAQYLADNDPFPDHPLFASVEHIEFPHAERYTAERLIAQVNTFSRMIVAAERDRDRINTAMREYLSSRPETSAGEFELPILTSAYRAERVTPA